MSGAYAKSRVQHADGSWSICHTLQIPASALSFEDLHPKSSYLRQQEIARMHYARAVARGEEGPHIMTWTAMQTDRRASELFPNLDYDCDGEVIISANSFVSLVLRRMLAEGWLQLHEFVGDTYEWHAKAPAHEAAWQARAAAVTKWMEASIALDLYPNIERGSYEPRIFEDFDSALNFARIGRCDFVRHFVQHHERAAAFNTSHFLHEHDDLISHHSGYGDAVGLMVAASTILRPPLYRRGCLLHDGARWSLQVLSMDDVVIILPGEIELCAGPGDHGFQLNPAASAPITIYTRAGGLAERGCPLQRTPSDGNRVEFIIVNRQILSQKRGGGLPIPQNGFALSFAEDALPAAAIEGIANAAWIEYEFADEAQNIVKGIQAGPILLRDGAVRVAESLRQEEFYASQVLDGEPVVGITPVKMRPSPHDERKARTAIGIKPNGDLLLLLVDGCDADAATPYDSAGATLHETAEWLRQRGAVDGLNLSGEGSAHLFVAGGLANRPSDRRGMPGIVYERMLPSIGVVSALT